MPWCLKRSVRTQCVCVHVVPEAQYAHIKQCLRHNVVKHSGNEGIGAAKAMLNG